MAAASAGARRWAWPSVTAALDRLIDTLPSRVDQGADEADARTLARDVALAVQAALLAQTAPAAVFGAFCESRLKQPHDVFGTLAGGSDFDTLIRRAMPA